MSDNNSFLIYQDDNGVSNVNVRFEGEDVWLSAEQLQQLFQASRQDVAYHIQQIYKDGEMSETGTCKKILQVRQEGERSVKRNFSHYNLDMILAIGMRIRSDVATRFRQWAIRHLHEFAVKGFTLDDNRLKGNRSRYFRELLQRVRDIRMSERNFYQKVTDIFATSIDYDRANDITRTFFATEQNKLHFAAYAAVEKLDPLSSKDILKAHGLMTAGLVDNPGKWRKCNVGVFNARGEAMHHAPPRDQVPLLMKDLFAWLKRSKEVPLVKSCIFHFVFETIHPFPDGNGRMGRLWQTAILGKWNPLFYAAPVENMVLCHQRRYYRALHESQVTGDAAPFVEFMLDVILRTIKARGVPKSAAGGKKSGKKGGKKTGDRVLDLLARNPKLTFAGMVETLGISRSAIQKHVEHLKDAQRLRRIGPDKGGHWEVIKESVDNRRAGVGCG